MDHGARGEGTRARPRGRSRTVAPPPTALRPIIAAVLALPATAGLSETDVFVPLAPQGARTSRADCCTTVEGRNLGATAAEVRLLPVTAEPRAGAAAPYGVVVAPGETLRIEDARGLMPGVTPCGALRVVSSARVIVRWAPCASATGPPPSGDRDTLREALPGSVAIGVGERTEVAVDVAAESAAPAGQMCRLILLEVAGGPVRVRVEPRDPRGAPLAPAVELSLAPHTSLTVECEEHFPALSAPAARFTVAPLSGAGRVLCFGGRVFSADEHPPVEPGTTAAGSERKGGRTTTSARGAGGEGGTTFTP